jgi:intein-encoded DNA endonuclease-like protein
VIACVSGSARDRLENLTLPIWWMTNSKSREEAISKLYDDLVFNVMFSVDESREIVKNYLAELHISDDSNEALISNLQSA